MAAHSLEDEVARNQLALVIKGGNIGKEVFIYALKKALEARNNLSGAVSFKQLQQVSGMGKLVPVPIDQSNIQMFEQHAKHYGVAFALKQNQETGDHHVFFRAKDQQQIDLAFKACIKEQMNTPQKPSIKAELEQSKAQAKTQDREPEKTKDKVPTLDR